MIMQDCHDLEVRDKITEQLTYLSTKLATSPAQEADEVADDKAKVEEFLAETVSYCKYLLLHKQGDLYTSSLWLPKLSSVDHVSEASNEKQVGQKNRIF